MLYKIPILIDARFQILNYNFCRSSTTIILCIVAATILKIKERLREKVAQCSNQTGANFEAFL